MTSEVRTNASGRKDFKSDNDPQAVSSYTWYCSSRVDLYRICGLYKRPSIARQEYQSSTAVFVGCVFSEEFTSESTDYQDGTTYRMHVEEVLRGSPAQTVKLFSENSSGRFPMQVDAKYLIYAHEELGRLQVDNCGNSGVLPEKAQALATLHKMTR